jgi:hypothetical protein
MKLNQGSTNKTGTNFLSSEDTTKKSTARWPGFPSSDELMSAAGMELVSFTAPSSPYVVRTTSTPAVKESKNG